MTSQNNGLPLDIRPEWLNLIRNAQAACKANQGYAVVRIEVVVNKNRPVLWRGARIISQIQPSGVANIEMTPEVAAALMAAMGVTDID